LDEVRRHIRVFIDLSRIAGESNEQNRFLDQAVVQVARAVEIDPRCKKTLREATRVPPLQNEDGLIAYECPTCSYVTSVIWPAKGQTEV
jgi:hypothetical protein